MFSRSVSRARGRLSRSLPWSRTQVPGQRCQPFVLEQLLTSQYIVNRSYCVILRVRNNAIMSGLLGESRSEDERHRTSPLVFELLDSLRLGSGTDVASGIPSPAAQPHATSGVPFLQKVRLASIHCAAMKDHDRGGGQRTAVGVYFWRLPFSVFLSINYQVKIKSK